MDSKRTECGDNLTEMKKKSRSKSEENVGNQKRIRRDIWNSDISER